MGTEGLEEECEKGRRKSGNLTWRQGLPGRKMEHVNKTFRWGHERSRGRGRKQDMEDRKGREGGRFGRKESSRREGKDGTRRGRGRGELGEDYKVSKITRVTVCAGDERFDVEKCDVKCEQKEKKKKVQCQPHGVMKPAGRPH
eukprot:746338-Hanusia_phi.AAC.3